MSQLRVSVHVDAPPDHVWEALSDISTHVQWMADAESILFTSESTAGVGTTFECRTVVGPLATVDLMEITVWEPPRRMGVRHSGVVTGTGEFHLEAAGSGTTFTWEEDLRFPWWAGGPLTGAAAVPVLRRVWTGSLRRFAGLVENGELPVPRDVSPPASGTAAG